MAAKWCELPLNPSSSPLTGNMIIKLAVEHRPDGGDVAGLSATITSTIQNVRVEEMGKVFDNCPGINVVGMVYGDDLVDKCYREANGLMQTYPDQKSIIAPTSVGIGAVAQAVADTGKIRDVDVTSLGLPSKWSVPSNPVPSNPSRSGSRSI